MTSDCYTNCMSKNYALSDQEYIIIDNKYTTKQVKLEMTNEKYAHGPFTEDFSLHNLVLVKVPLY